MATARESKRILSVTVTREVDTDPDTSWLGEYASSPSSEYSIDRAHAEDCHINDHIGQAKIESVIDQLERAIDYLNDARFEDGEESEWYESISDAQDILIERQDLLREDMECDCDERGDMNRGEYRYFNPSSNYNGEPAEDIRKYVRQDYERIEAYNRQQWCFLGVHAEAQVQTNGLSTIQTIQSGGLWGIESDSGDGYFAEVEKDELDALRSELHAIGFTKRSIAAAFRNVEHADN